MTQEDRVYTEEEFEAMPLSYLIEFNSGKLVNLPQPPITHNEIIMKLILIFGDYMRQSGGMVLNSVGTRLMLKDGVKILIPDIVVILDKTTQTGNYIESAPDMIVEVTLASNKEYDKVTKLNWYREAGVKEYWVIEPEEKIISVFIMQGNEKYGRPELYSDDDKIKVGLFNDLIIDASFVVYCSRKES